MIYLLFTFSLVGYVILKTVQRQSDATERKYAITKSISHFLLIFCIVAFIFSLLQLWLDNTTEIDTAKATILNIEQVQFKIKDFANHFKIGFKYDVLILFLLIALASTFPVFEQYGVRNKLKKYNKLIKSILFFLTIATSFTFFGNRFVSNEEGRIGKLEFHKLQILEDNKLLLKKINDEVTNRVVNEIIANPEIEKELDNIETAKKYIEDVKNTRDYKKYFAVAPSNFISNLSITAFENDFSKYDFASSFENAERKFEDANHHNSATETDFYKAQEESNYSKFKEANKEWFNESNFSENSAKQAEEILSKVTSAEPTEYAKYYAKYKEPIEKLIKKGYTNTGSKWIKTFFEMIGVDFPFLDEFIDPIINEPIQDFITKKTAAILKACTQSQSETETNVELKKCSTEFEETFATKVNSNEKFANLQKEISGKVSQFELVSILTETQIQDEMRKAETHLSDISYKSRWEEMRQEFSRRLENFDEELSDFTTEQRQTFKNVLSQWENYKAEQKLSWYFGSVDNIEDQFFNFSKNDGTVKACWGFILQQEDWDGAANYYTNIHPDATATGKPYYMLKYYYNSIGEGDQFERLYDNETNNGVGTICPH